MKATASNAALILSLFLLGAPPIVTALVGPARQPFLSRNQQRQQQYQRRKTLATAPYVATQVAALAAKKAGTFFNPVPDEEDSDGDDEEEEAAGAPVDMDSTIQDLIKSRNSPSKASEPSTINGVPTAQAGVGFGSKKATSAPTTTIRKESLPTSPPKPYTAIGAPVNDVTKPEYDDQGYTVYTDEQTGEKSRVFEALVDYPTLFTMKIVGANEGLFVQEMVAVVAESCNVQVHTVQHSVRTTGKWTSVTVMAPVESAKMLYELYEAVDRDPRVKFKF
jgi:putative lipoic acid-binding regulatory protein